MRRFAAPCDGFVLQGGVYVDEVHTVESFPEEDSACRSLGFSRRVGGNCGNASSVLVQLVPSGTPVLWMGCVPSEECDDKLNRQLALGELERRGIGLDLMEACAHEPGVGFPSATIIVAQRTGTRTIISSRRGLREVSLEHFQHSVRRALAWPRTSRVWIHLEVREMPTVSEMASHLRPPDGLPGLGCVSVEVEKPFLPLDDILELLSHVDVAFLSS